MAGWAAILRELCCILMVEKVSQRGLAHPLLQTQDQGAEASGTGGSVWPPADPQMCCLTETWLLQRVFWARLSTVSWGLFQPLLWQRQCESPPALA